MNPRATIVTALKRQQDAWLDRCVRSAVEQSVPCEAVVVHATDTPPSNLAVLESIARDHQNLRVMLEEKPGSFPGAINLAIRRAHAGRIGFLLSDDWLDPDAVAQCLEVDADIVSSGNTVYYADGETVQQAACANLTMSRYLSCPTLESKAAYLQHFFLFRKEAIVRAGGLDESIGNFPGIDDYDLIWTLLERGATVGIIERRLYHYRDHDGDRLTLANRAEAVRNLEKILRKHKVPEQDIPQLVGGHARWYGKPIYRVLDAPAG